MQHNAVLNVVAANTCTGSGDWLAVQKCENLLKWMELITEWRLIRGKRDVYLLRLIKDNTHHQDRKPLHKQKSQAVAAAPTPNKEDYEPTWYKFSQCEVDSVSSEYITWASFTGLTLATTRGGTPFVLLLASVSAGMLDEMRRDFFDADTQTGNKYV